MKQGAIKQKGFTIVELLIVIVVIGILAAITIVAFNGIQKRTQDASAQSAVSQANKKVLAYAATNSDTYPPTIGDAGIVSTADTLYQYSVNNTSSPRTYCITATVAKSNYSISNSSTSPTSGACPGHGVNGVAPITNLVPNPDFEAGLSGYGATAATAGMSRISTGQSGDWHMGITRLATGDAYVSYTLSNFAIAGNTFTVSVWAKGNGSAALFGNTFIQEVGSTSRSLVTVIPANTVIPATWTRYSVTFTAPSDATPAFRIIFRTGTAVSDLIEYDAVMITSGSTLYNFADGDSTGWAWNNSAAPNASTSSGPPLQ